MSLDASKFIYSSDFPTLKNDNTGDTSVTVPASFAVAGSGSWESHSGLNIGVQGSIAALRIKVEVNGISAGWVSAQWLPIDTIGVNSGSPAPYSIYAFVWRPSAGVLRFQVFIPNPYGSTLTTDANTTVLTFHAETFIPPFA